MTIPGLTLAIFAAALQSCGGGVVKEDPSELPESASPLYISEYMCAERWVEIYNPTDSIIDLHGYSLIAGARKRKAEIHEIGPKGYVLFKDLHDMEEGMPIYLKDNEGALVDIVDNPKHKKNKSTTRLLLGDGWRTDATPAILPSPLSPDTLTVTLDTSTLLLQVQGYSRTDYVLPLIGREGNYHSLEISLYSAHLRRNMALRAARFLAR